MSGEIGPTNGGNNIGRVGYTEKGRFHNWQKKDAKLSSSKFLAEAILNTF